MQRRNFLKTLGGSLAIIHPAAATANGAARPLELVRDGQSNYKIAISREASPSEKRGSEELQRFIEQMSGARLPIVTDEQKVPAAI